MDSITGIFCPESPDINCLFRPENSRAKERSFILFPLHQFTFNQTQTNIDQKTNKSDQKHSSQDLVRSMNIPGGHNHVAQAVALFYSGKFGSNQSHPANTDSDSHAC